MENSAIEIIEVSIKTHQHWLDFFTKFPESENKKSYKNLGGASFHRQRIDDLGKAITAIELIQGKLNELTEHEKGYSQLLGSANSDVERQGKYIDKLQTWINRLKDVITTQGRTLTALHAMFPDCASDELLLQFIENLKAENVINLAEQPIED